MVSKQITLITVLSLLMGCGENTTQESVNENLENMKEQISHLELTLR